MSLYADIKKLAHDFPPLRRVLVPHLRRHAAAQPSFDKQGASAVQLRDVIQQHPKLKGVLNTLEKAGLGDPVETFSGIHGLIVMFPSSKRMSARDLKALAGVREIRWVDFSGGNPAVGLEGFQID